MNINLKTCFITCAVVLILGGTYVFSRNIAHSPVREKELSAYENTTYGFVMRFPKEITSVEKTETESTPGNVVFSVALSDKETGAPLAEVTVAPVPSGLPKGADSLPAPDGMDPVSSRDLIIAGAPARVYNEGKEGVVYVVANNGYRYAIYPHATADMPSPETLFSFSK
ncbi:MAG: hypothetical protein HGA67_04120 [Candidatus Yonathbacteria bacterium]|nr:hypothetical protein [Candidatus Yonathbacteria bacterium]